MTLRHPIEPVDHVGQRMPRRKRRQRAESTEEQPSGYDRLPLVLLIGGCLLALSTPTFVCAGEAVTEGRRLRSRPQHVPPSQSFISASVPTVDHGKGAGAKSHENRILQEDVISLKSSRQAGVSSSCSSDELDWIKTPLYESDTDGNGLLSQEEYLTFIDSASGGFVSEKRWGGSFRDLPLGLQENYVVLSCLCELYNEQDWGGSGCCEGGPDSTGIRTEGAGPDDNPGLVEESYLTYVCGTTNESLNSVGAQIVAPPTSSPTAKPSTAPPTNRPSPTVSPEGPPRVTPFPTIPPSSSPIEPVTNAPVAIPTSESPVDAPTPVTGSPVLPSTPTRTPSVTTKAPTATDAPIALAKPTVRPESETPTLSPVTSSPTVKESGAPSDAPTLSFEPTIHPFSRPSLHPSLSLVPTISAQPSIPPTTSASPSVSSAPVFNGKYAARVAFISYIVEGKLTAEEIMRDDPSNQVRVMLEEDLFELSNQIILRDTVEISEDEGGEPFVRRKLNRRLTIESATLAYIDSATDVSCRPNTPGEPPRGAPCILFNSTITLNIVDEPNVAAEVSAFETALLTAIAEGWLEENFDLDEALQPPPNPPPPVPLPLPNPNEKPDTDRNGGVASNSLSPGAIAGIVIAAIILVGVVILFAARRSARQRTNDKSSSDYEMERSQVVKSSDLSADFGPDEESQSTANKSFTSTDHLLAGQEISSATPTTSALGPLQTEPDGEDSTYYDPSEDESDQPRSSPLAAMAAASTLVSSSNANDSNANERTASDIEELDRIAARSIQRPDDPVVSGASSSVGSGGVNLDQAVPSGDGGINTGAAAAIGGAVVGGLAAGAYAATRRGSSKNDVDEAKASNTSDVADAKSRSPVNELDSAIEAGDWGRVGALAAVLASDGNFSPPPPSAAKRDRSSVNLSSSNSFSSKSRDSTAGQGSIDHKRAAEIDRLVETGDWQGVVLAAARFEADQSLEDGSHSASASQSSRWTGSATSATTPRSMGTSNQSSKGASSGRGQEEIRAEVEALVRRVVPEEADNVEEMLTQFKGREEELLETLRRMQERAIASRARLAVQKSAKLEARSKASPSRVSQSTAKSDLETAIEAGDWSQVGEAAQKMSDQSVGSLSVEEKSRLRVAVANSPAMSRQPSDNSLDELIEQGDWPGVIAAAKRASQGNVNPSDRPGSSMSQEEKDAIAQANMWEQIANQSKQGGRTDAAGAGDAAKWAIDRAMNTSGEGEVRTTRNIADIVNSDDSSADASQYESSSASQDYRHVI